MILTINTCISYLSNTKTLVIDELYCNHIINPNEERLTEIAAQVSGITCVNDLPDHNLTEDLKKLWETLHLLALCMKMWWIKIYDIEMQYTQLNTHFLIYTFR